MMAKSVLLKTGRAFKTIKAAKEHFARVLAGQKLNKPFTGQALQDVQATYEEYCNRTGWRLKSPPASFYPTVERGPGFTTRCYGVMFQDGTTDRFSMEKALRAIAG
ncbi:MAG: hypothetical protein NVSMB26_07890 [Beijerinckiaceae bacterium]